MKSANFNKKKTSKVLLRSNIIDYNDASAIFNSPFSISV